MDGAFEWLRCVQADAFTMGLCQPRFGVAQQGFCNSGALPRRENSHAAKMTFCLVQDGAGNCADDLVRDVSCHEDKHFRKPLRGGLLRKHSVQKCGGSIAGAVFLESCAEAGENGGRVVS